MPTLKNGRHELFAQHVAKGKTADEAYQLAGYKPHRGNACTLRAKQNVADRLAELQEKVAARAVTSAADIIHQLAEDRDFARFLGAPSAAVSATLGQAKVLGLLKERHEHTGKDGAALEVDAALTVEEKSLYQVARELAYVLELARRQAALDAPITVEGESVRQAR